MKSRRSPRRVSRVAPVVLALTLAGVAVSPAQRSAPPAASAASETKPDAGAPGTIPTITVPPAPASAESAAAAALHPQLSARQQRRAEDAYLDGARWLERNRPEKATAEFEKSLKLNPESVEAAKGLAVAKDHWATSLVQQAASWRLHGDAAQADRLLVQAAKVAPDNAMVQQHRAQPEAPAKAAAPPTLDTLFPQSPYGDPDHPYMTAKTASDLAHLAGPVHIRPASVRRDLDLRGDPQSVVQQVAAAFGVKASFQGSVSPKLMRLTLAGADYATAMPLALRMGHLFAVPIDSSTLLVADDTQENRDKYERQVEETIYLPGLSVEQMNDVSNMARSIFDIKKTSVPKEMNDLVLRGSEDTLHALNLTLASMIDGGAQVMLEVKLFEVNSSRMRNLGVSLPQQVGAYNVESEAQKLVSANQSTVDEAVANGLATGSTPTETLLIEALFLLESGLATDANLSNTIYGFGGGKTLTGIYVGSFPTLNLGLNESESRTLDDFTLRLDDKQPGSVRSGSKYPVITGSYSSNSALSSTLAGATVNGVSVSSLLGAATTIPQFQYEDLGLTLKATPTIQRSGEITVHLDLKIEALTGQSLSSIPILDNRSLTSDVTLMDGQTATVVSFLSGQEAAAVAGIPGLSELPGFQGSTDKDVQVSKSELVILLTPHITRKRLDLLATPRITMHVLDTDD